MYLRVLVGRDNIKQLSPLPVNSSWYDMGTTSPTPAPLAARNWLTHTSVTHDQVLVTWSQAPAMVFIAGLCVCEHGTVVYLQYNTQNFYKKSISDKYFFSFKGTVAWDGFPQCWRKLTDPGLKCRGWFLNFSEAPLILRWNKTSSLW